ncbi:MAG: HD domain-containing phosphohydrolase [Roseburia sp.]
MTKFLYAWIYLVVAAIVAYYFLKSFHKKDRIGKTLNRMITCGLIAILSYMGTMISNSYFVMSLGNSLVFMMIDWMLFFFLEYSYFLFEKKEFPKKSGIVLLFALGCDNVVLACNPFLECALTYRQVVAGKDIYVVFEPYAWFQCHLAICYVMVAGASFLLIRKCLETPKVYRRRYAAILIGMLGVIAINGVFLVLDLTVDFSIILYCILACLFYFYTFQYEPLGLQADVRKYIFENMNDPVLLFDNQNKLVMYNKSAGGFFKLEKKMTLSQFCIKNPYLTPNNKKRADILEVVLEKDGESSWYQIQYKRLVDQKNRFTGTMIVYNEVPAQKRAMEQMEYDSTHDLLTGLYNRNYLLKYTKEQIRTIHTPVSLGLFNINGLKGINQVYGSEAGDKVLCKVADFLKQNLRKNDFAARIDGDEMVLVMPGTDADTAEHHLQKLFTGMQELEVDGKQVSVEYGQATYGEKERNHELAFQEARNEMVQRKMMNQTSARSSILKSLEKTLIERDYETEQHAVRTRDIAMKLGKHLGLKQKEISELGLLAVLHDIGKVAIPENILNKKDRLTDEEWEIMKGHTVKGYEIAKITPELSQIADFILCHHERWDGKGYPCGLKGEEIPLLSRIITVVDSHDVMTHDRIYHKAMTQEESIKELKRCSGTQFDPMVVTVFIRMLQEKESYELGIE